MNISVFLLGVVVNAQSPGTQNTEAGWLQAWGQPEQLSETQSLNKNLERLKIQLNGRVTLGSTLDIKKEYVFIYRRWKPFIFRTLSLKDQKAQVTEVKLVPSSSMVKGWGTVWGREGYRAPYTFFDDNSVNCWQSPNPGHLVSGLPQKLGCLDSHKEQGKCSYECFCPCPVPPNVILKKCTEFDHRK